MEIFESIRLLNPFAVATSALVMLVVGLLWYSPFLFGKSWVRLSGIRPGDIRPHEVRRGFIYGAIICVLTSVLLGLFAQHCQGSLPMLLSGIGFIWLFVMFEQFGASTARREPFALFLLQTFRSLAALVAGGIVFHFWS